MYILVSLKQSNVISSGFDVKKINPYSDIQTVRKHLKKSSATVKVIDTEKIRKLTDRNNHAK